MHALQAMVVVAVLAVGLAAKLTVFPASEDEVKRDPIRTTSVNVLRDSLDVNSLPVEKIHDMTFVDPERD